MILALVITHLQYHIDNFVLQQENICHKSFIFGLKQLYLPLEKILYFITKNQII